MWQRLAQPGKAWRCSSSTLSLTLDPQQAILCPVSAPKSVLFAARLQIFCLILLALWAGFWLPVHSQSAPDATPTSAPVYAASSAQIESSQIVTTSEPGSTLRSLSETLTLSDELTPTIAAAPITNTTGVTVTQNELQIDAAVETVMERLTPADRVGQLFVVTFNGADTGFESPIAELIYAYRVGGVVLSPEQANFSNEPGADTPRQVAILANQLQAIAYGILLPVERALEPVPNQPWPPSNFTSLANETGVAPPNLPLLIAVEQQGDNLPGTALRRGFTALPSQLAIGATWNPALATGVGEIVGRELSAVGVNLLLGPNLDVVEQPRTDIVGSLGMFSFGGNPYWVSQMGRAYIAGVHSGSSGRVATIVRHFPGQGDTDRLPDSDVATIQKSLDELRAISFQPFLAATRFQSGPDDPAVTDGVQSSHMRYSALQGAAGRTTPISVDPALSQIFDLAGMSDWRDAGGVVMSGPLGVPAIRRFYDPALVDFPARRIALDAFTAGNDLLYLARFSLDDSWGAELDNMRATIAFFQERYRGDPDFAAQVDRAVRRILRLKLRIYGAAALDVDPNAPIVPLSQVLVQQEKLNVLPTAAAADADPVLTQVARESLTMLMPDVANQALAAAPQASERMLIFTDSRLQRECPDCTTEAALDPDAIARIIDQLYGLTATGQMPDTQVTSLTFADLIQLLDATPESTAAAQATSTSVLLPTPTPLGGTVEEPAIGVATAQPLDKNGRTEQLIADADWLIFAMLDINPAFSSSDALRRFLRQRSETLGNKRLIVLALNVPYFLDATEVSKLTAYYGIYSKTQPFLESAVRTIFRSFMPTASPAVDVPGTRFSSLVARLQPDPTRPLPLRVLIGDQVLAVSDTAQPTEERDAPPVVNVGDSIRIELGPVSDLNGHTVPDGVLVEFNVRFEGAELALAIEPATTRNGIVGRDLRLDRAGVLRIDAKAGAAVTARSIIVNVLDSQPTPLATSTISPTVTPLAPTTPVTSALVTTATTAAGQPMSGVTGVYTPRVNAVTLLLTLFTILIMLAMLVLAQARILARPRLFVSLLWATIMGLGAYIVYGLGWLPGSNRIAAALNVFGAPAVVVVAMILPLLWLQVRSLTARR